MPAIGAQLYIFQKAFDLEDRAALRNVLQGLATAGYAEIEGFLGAKNDYRDLLAEYNLRYAGAHCVLSELEDVQSAADYVKRMDGSDICCSGLIQWHERSADDYRAAIELLNAKGRVLRSQGIYLHYHNHDFEFERVDGDQTGMDLLLAGLDSGAVNLCLDTGWVWRAGLDPAAFLHSHREKIGVVHLRDFKGDDSVPLGAGDMDIKPILDALPPLPNLRRVIVEQDPTETNSMDCMTQSRGYLRRFEF